MELLVALGFVLVIVAVSVAWQRAAVARAVAEQRESLVRLEAQLESSHQQLQRAEAELQSDRESLQQLRAQNAQLSEARARIESEVAEKERSFAVQLRQLEESKATLKREFEALAQEILEAKGKSFQEQSQQRLDALLKPMATELKGFKERIESIHQFDNEQRTKLTTELQHLKDLNVKITTEAERLSSALQGQKKMQGNWGELMLENVLDSSGLRRDKDYKREVSIDTEEGRMRPDVVVYLPQSKHLVIDAKTSLAAYTRYVNAEDPTENMLMRCRRASKS